MDMLSIVELIAVVIAISIFGFFILKPEKK